MTYEIWESFIRTQDYRIDSLKTDEMMVNERHLRYGEWTLQAKTSYARKNVDSMEFDRAASGIALQIRVNIH